MAPQLGDVRIQVRDAGGPVTRRRSWEQVSEPLFGEDWWAEDQRLFADSLARALPPTSKPDRSTSMMARSTSPDATAFGIDPVLLDLPQLFSAAEAATGEQR